VFDRFRTTLVTTRMSKLVGISEIRIQLVPIMRRASFVRPWDGTGSGFQMAVISKLANALLITRYSSF